MMKDVPQYMGEFVVVLLNRGPALWYYTGGDSRVHHWACCLNPGMPCDGFTWQGGSFLVACRTAGGVDGCSFISTAAAVVSKLSVPKCVAGLCERGLRFAGSGWSASRVVAQVHTMSSNLGNITLTTFKNFETLIPIPA